MRKLRILCWPLLLLIAGSGLYFIANVQRVAIPGAIFGTLQAELGASASQITWLGASFMYVYALNQITIGFLIVRYGGRRVILCGSLIFCAGITLFPLCHNLTLLYLSRILAGLGGSALYLSLIHEARRTFRGGHFSLAVSMVIFTGYAGGILSGAPFVIAANAMGWRSLLLALAVFALLCGLLFAAACGMDKSREKCGTPLPFSFRPFLEILHLRNNRNIFLCAGMHFGLYYVLQTVLGKKFLEDFLRLPQEKAGWILSLMAVLAAVSGFVPVVLSRWTGWRIRTFLIGAGSMSVFVCLGLTVMTGFCVRSPMVAVLLCMLPMTASLSPIVIPLLYRTNAPERSGLAVCLFNFSLFFFVALFGNAAGWLLNAFAPKSAAVLWIYGQEAWLAVFSVLLLFSLGVLIMAFRISEMGVTSPAAPQDVA